jgi:hypothetical protein
MKKQYEATIEEFVHTKFRLAELTGTISNQKWIGLVFALIASFALCGILDASLKERTIVFLLWSFIYIPFYLIAFKNLSHYRIRKAILKIIKTNKPVSSEFEIDESGLACRYLGQELKFSWGNVDKLNDADDSIEVIMKPTGIAIIPKRIFEEPAELQKWIQFIEDHRVSKN